MATVSSTLAASAQLETQKSSTDKSKLVGSFDTFLTLLTTQLKNQSPTDPLDVNQFTQQLVQYSTVEQQIQSNEHLESLLATVAAANVASFVNYIGKEVSATGDVAYLGTGGANWSYTAGGDAAEAVVRVSDESGNVVYNELTSLKSGEGSFSWDGRADDGRILPRGYYRISIVANDNGQPVVVETNDLEGEVTAVDMTGSQPALTVNGVTVPLTSVTRVLTGS